MKRFDYIAPTSLSEALEALRATANVAVLGGGTDLLVQIKEGGRWPSQVVSLRRIPDLRGIAWDVASGLRIGAATLLADVAASDVVRARYPALAEGAGLIGSVQTRNMGTLGGNICNAAPSADTAPALLIYDAVVHIAGATGARRLPLAEFFTGPGATALQPGELVTAFTLPPPPERTGSVYQRHTPRRAMDIAVVGVGCRVCLDDSGVIADAAVALGAVAPTPIRSVAAEALLRGERPSEALFQRAAEAARDESRPISDARGSEGFRRELVRVMTARCLAIAVARAAGVA